MKPAPFDYTRPATLAEAVAALADGDADVKPIAGGQSLGPMMNLRLARPTKLVDISRLGELRGAAATPDSVAFGAAITHAEIEDGAAPDPLNGFLARVAGAIAYRAVRNRGTIGGSLAHADPAADWLTALTAVDARVVAARAAPGQGGLAYRAIPVGALVLGAYATALEPGELIARIEIARGGDGLRWGYHKLCRKVGELADAIGAVVVDGARGLCRVVAGSVGGAPVLLPQASEEIARAAAAPPRDAIAAEIAALLPRLDAVKRQQLMVVVERAVAEALAR